MATTMVEVDILVFLRTGSFGPIQFGINSTQLEEVLGPADAAGITSRKERHPTIFKYGDIEFYVDPKQDRFYAIHSDYFTIPRGNARLQLQMHGIDNGTTLSQMKEILHGAGITFTERVDQFEGKRLVTEGNVILGFGEVASDGRRIDQDGCLDVISRFNYAVLEREQPTRQIAITIPETTYEMIRKEALHQRISIAKLCSRWVMESVERHDSDQQ